MDQSTLLGRHQSGSFLEDPPKLFTWPKLRIAFAVCYGFAVTVPSLVILNLYIPIFVQKAYRTTTYVIMGLCTTDCVVSTLVTCLTCVPMAVLWDPTISNARCIDVLAW